MSSCYFFTSILLFLSGAATSWTRAMAHPLKADTGVVSGRITDVSKNPANLAHIKYGHLTLFVDVYRKSHFVAKFEGLEPAEKKNAGFLNINPGNFASPANFPFVFGSADDSYGVAFSVFPIPPMNLSWISSKAPIDDIPIYLFRQVERLSAKVDKLQVKGGLLASVAYRFRRFSIGVSGRYFAADIGLVANIQDTNEEVLRLASNAALVDLTLGLRFKVIPGWLDVGISTPAYSLLKANTSVEAGLVKQSLDVDNSESVLFKTASMGLQLRVDRFSVFLDLHYAKAQSSQGVSLSQFRVGEKDYYDTFSPGVGLEFRITRRLGLLAGYYYQAADLGDGSSEVDGKIGFGSIDMTEVFIGSNNLKPYQTVSLGFEYRLWNTSDRKRRSEKSSKKAPYNLLLSFGASLRSASRGIGPDGTEPATYVDQLINFPLGITYFY